MKIILPLVGLLCASITVCAQQPTPTPIKQVVQRPCCSHRLPRRTAVGTSTAAPVAPTPVAPDFFVGEAKVEVTKDETVVRLAMAQHGSVLIELPANDGPRYIIPGDPEMATVDEKALERNKRAIVVRPGSLFISPPLNRKAHSPAATVTVQMRSGLVVTFLFYPVEDLAQNVHRCVLSYNRDEVVARRRAAGLPVNLDSNSVISERRDSTGQSAAPISISVDTSIDTKPSDQKPPNNSSVSDQSEKSTKAKAEDADKTAPLATVAKPEADNSAKTNMTAERPQTLARDALSQAIKKPSRFKNWTKAVHGLSLSAIQQTDSKNDFQTIVVGVRNNSNDTLKLTAGAPDLLIEMLDDQGKALNIESVRKLFTEASDSSGAILPKATIYYAIAYASPMLGVNQQLKVAVTQTNVADEPASINVTKRGR